MCVGVWCVWCAVYIALSVIACCIITTEVPLRAIFASRRIMTGDMAVFYVLLSLLSGSSAWQTGKPTAKPFDSFKVPNREEPIQLPIKDAAPLHLPRAEAEEFIKVPLIVASPPSTKAVHETITRRAKVAKTGHERSLSTPFTVACEGLASSTCGANLASALAGSHAVLELEAGTYTHSFPFTIERDVVVRAKTTGTVVLDGENTRTVMEISSGTAAIEGIDITNGLANEWGSAKGGGVRISGSSTSANFDGCNIYKNTAGYDVIACIWKLPCPFFLRPRRKKLLRTDQTQTPSLLLAGVWRLHDWWHCQLPVLRHLPKRCSILSTCSPLEPSLYFPPTPRRKNFLGTDP